MQTVAVSRMEGGVDEAILLESRLGVVSRLHPERNGSSDKHLARRAGAWPVHSLASAVISQVQGKLPH